MRTVTAPATPVRRRWLGGAIAAVLGVIYAVLGFRAAAAPVPGPFEAAVFLVPIMLAAGVLASKSKPRALWLGLWFVGCALLVAARDRLGPSTPWVVLLQHAGMHALLGVVFGRSLAAGAVPLVSRMATLVHGSLSPLLARYTRRVTLAWVIYFFGSAVLSVLLFALAPAPVWSAYVNLLAMPLLVAMFAGEFIVRTRVIPRSERSGFMDAVNAYRRFSASSATRGSATE